MLKKILEPFVWVIGLAAGTVFFVNSFATANAIDIYILNKSSPDGIACLGLFVANVLAIVWIVTYFGARKYKVASGILFWSFMILWIIAGGMVFAGNILFGNPE